MFTERAKHYERDSFIDPRIEIRPSKLQGLGIFAKEQINEGEVVILWGGVLFNEKDLKLENVRPNSPVEVGEGIFLAEPASGEPCEDEFMNHSCYPNLWMADEVTLLTRRDIEAGEELTLDYAMFFSSRQLANLYEFECKCGSGSCRGAITADDWKLNELQERYKDHFSPYLNARIQKAPV